MAAAPWNPNSTSYYPYFSPQLPPYSYSYSSPQPPLPPYFPPPFYVNQTPCHETIITAYYCSPPLTLHYSHPVPSSSSVTISEVDDDNIQQVRDDGGAPIIVNKNNKSTTQVKEKKQYYHSKFVKRAPALNCSLRRRHRNGEMSRFESMMRLGEQGSELKTTVMIKNIPNGFNKKMVLNLLDCHCVNENKKLEVDGGGGDRTPSEFDFMYLPIDFRTGSNYGFAFVNFTSPGAAWRLHRELHDKSWELYGSKKVCQLNYARIQGLNALVEHFSASIFCCRSDEYLPVYFTPGRDGARATEEHVVGKHLPVHCKKLASRQWKRVN